MLSEGIAAKRGRYGAYVHRDRVNGTLRARRGARLAAITSGGAIPDNSLYTVTSRSQTALSLEPWTKISRWESNRGDIMLLGNTSWMIHRIETNAGRMLVQDAHGRRRVCRFGEVKLRRGRRNCRAMWENCGKKSASGCRAHLR